VRYILAQEHVDVLAQVAWSRVLVAFDFDGTLAPIVADRDRAVMRKRTRALLKTVCALYPCAIISGRARSDVATRVDDVGAKYIIGNHGIEPGSDIQGFERQIALVRPLLEEALAEHAGVEVEDKRYSLAIHYRRARLKREARTAIDRAIATLPRPMRVIPGKLVANIVPVGARNKGDILLALRDQEVADVALYVGDDVTDEDVFTIDQPGRLLALRIGKTTRSSARFYLRDQRETDALLAHLVKFREDRL
jgi:trehalose 6-phosphate phosphatase